MGALQRNATVEKFLKKRERFDAKMQRRANRLSAKESQPTKTRDEVYITNGMRYHDYWCSAVNGVWLSGSNVLQVVPYKEICCTKRPCRICAQMGYTGKR
jgi:hypothetical protein